MEAELKLFGALFFHALWTFGLICAHSLVAYAHLAVGISKETFKRDNKNLFLLYVILSVVVLYGIIDILKQSTSFNVILYVIISSLLYLLFWFIAYYIGYKDKS
jgi:phosphoglycerol transferase MdoB-like AlkP superfamily enzyme